MLFGAGILFLYPLRGAYLQKIQQQVLVLHAEKHARLEEMQRVEALVGEEPLAPGD